MTTMCFLFLLQNVLLLSTDGEKADQTSQPEPMLQLDVRPHANRVVEKAPLVLRITLENHGTKEVMTYFKSGRYMSSSDFFSLHAVDATGADRELKPLALLAITSVRSPGAPLAPGASLATGYAMCLSVVAESQQGQPETETRFLAPGRYRMYATLDCPPVIRSAEFEVTVTPAAGDDAAALALMPELPYYAQGAAFGPKDDAVDALGGPPQRVRETLARIQSEHPGSVFATWIQYWSKFAAMDTKNVEDGARAAGDAMMFAEQHSDFPMVDELMLRTAKRLARAGQKDRAVDIVRQIQTRFPATTCSKEEMGAILSQPSPR